MIQYISNIKRTEQIEGIIFSGISRPNSLDDFDINIIDFSNESLWRYNYQNYYEVNLRRDIQNLGVMIKQSRNTKFVVLFPQNETFRYYKNGSQYIKSEELKNIISTIEKVVNEAISMKDISFIYEPTKTKIDESEISADFHFDIPRLTNFKRITFSTSKKTTSILINNYLYTTLYIQNDFVSLFNLMDLCGFIEYKTEAPDWFKDMRRLNDNELYKEREILQDKLKSIEKEIGDNDLKIQKNHEFKSILYSSGRELEITVLEILSKILAIDLTNFKDEKKEDFHFEFNGIHYIGEIKGKNENLKNENLRQLNEHIETYQDENKLEDENIKGLLIFNPLRKTAPNEREAIHSTQINKAKNKYNILIIRTQDLLDLFEKYILKDLSKERIIDIITNQKGLINIKD